MCNSLYDGLPRPSTSGSMSFNLTATQRRLPRLTFAVQVWPLGSLCRGARPCTKVRDARSPTEVALQLPLGRG